MKTPSNIGQLQQSCRYCKARSRCIAKGLEQHDSIKLHEIVKQQHHYKPEEPLYRQGDVFSSIFIIQHGVVKSEVYSYDGFQVVTGFYYSGDLIGVDAIAETVQTSNAIAIQPTKVCEIPYKKLEKLSATLPNLQHMLLQRLSQRIFHNEHHYMLGLKEMAKQRIIYFLLDFSKKLQESEYVRGNQIDLPMKKCDLASYLNLRPESLSRALTLLQDEGFIIKRGDYIEVVNQQCTDQTIHSNRSLLSRSMNLPKNRKPVAISLL